MKNGKRKSMEEEGDVEERHAKEKKKRVSAKIGEKEEDGAKCTVKGKTQDVKKKKHRRADETR